MSNFKPAVKVSGSSEFSTNALVFATREEAAASALDLFQRWMLCTDHGVVETSEPVNYVLHDGVLTSVKAGVSA